MKSIDDIVQLARRRGFVWQGSELYGGLSGMWDYGPLGFFLKENIKREWWRAMLKPHIFPIDAAVVMGPAVLMASGHLEHFTDPLVECKKCKKRFRADHIDGSPSARGGGGCPECGGQLSEARAFNMMFKTHTGAVEEEGSAAYLRPETAQGIFTNFKNIVDAFHPKLPFGIAQIGRAFRNEITPRNFLFRAREFEQMELEYFCEPKDGEQFFSDIRQMRMNWFLDLGIKKEHIRFRDYKKDELAHYSAATTDIEYRFGLGKEEFSELEGIANRTDYDLRSHYPLYTWVENDFVARPGGFVPNVIEPSLGLDRAFLAFLIDAFDEDNLGGEKRAVLRVHPKLAPYKAAVFPLVSNKEHIASRAREVFDLLYGSNIAVAWDDIGNIGKRYRRQDEIGTPWCITIDYETLENNTVTVRDRDTAEQVRVSVDELAVYIKDRLR